jgi:hypothetical protein
VGRIIVVLSVGALITLACCGMCTYTIQGEWDPTKEALTGAVLQEDRGNKGCTSILPPETLQESDIVGTWIAKYGSAATDTLILKEDGTYKQIYNNSITDYHYESDWQKWWLEHRESGIPHLHMEKMRKCDGISERCRREGGGGDDILWFDFCEHRMIAMRGEIILLVVSVPSNYFDQPPRGILLRQLSGDPDTVGGTFKLQE